MRDADATRRKVMEGIGKWESMLRREGERVGCCETSKVSKQSRPRRRTSSPDLCSLSWLFAVVLSRLSPFLHVRSFARHHFCDRWGGAHRFYVRALRYVRFLQERLNFLFVAA